MAKPISYRYVGKSINKRCEKCRFFGRKTSWCEKWKFVTRSEYSCTKWTEAIDDINQDNVLKEKYKVAVGDKIITRVENYAKPFTPRPNAEDYKVGFIYRHFAKQLDNPYAPVVEVDAKQYRSIGSKNSGLDGSHYAVVRIQWVIGGERKEVERSNTRLADFIEKRYTKMIGLRTLLYSNLLRFWEGGK